MNDMFERDMVRIGNRNGANGALRTAGVGAGVGVSYEVWVYATRGVVRGLQPITIAVAHQIISHWHSSPDHVPEVRDLIAMAAAIRRGISVYADGSDRRLPADAEAVFAKERRLATPAKVGIGNRYVGPIEAIVGDVVLQRVDGGELVAHDRASFSEDRADTLELSIGKEMTVGYEFDGPTLETVGRDLGIEL